MSIEPQDLSVEESQPILNLVSNSNSTFILNEKTKGSDLVEICKSQGGKIGECIEVKLAVTKCFALMQKQGFFCQLPFNPAQTEIECQRIEPIKERTK